MPFGYPIWSWFAKNPIAQAAAAVLAFLFLWKMNNIAVGRGATRRQRARNREDALKKDREILETSNEAIEQADSIRTGGPDYRSGRVPDSPASNYHYRD